MLILVFFNLGFEFIRCAIAHSMSFRNKSVLTFVTKKLGVDFSSLIILQNTNYLPFPNAHFLPRAFILCKQKIAVNGECHKGSDLRKLAFMTANLQDFQWNEIQH